MCPYSLQMLTSVSAIPARTVAAVLTSLMATVVPARQAGQGATVTKVRHYNDVRMSTMASQITSLTIAYSTVYSGIDQRKHQSSTSLAFVRGIHC